MRIIFKGNEYEFEKGISLFEISNYFSNQYKFEIILGKVNNETVDLNHIVNSDCEIDFYDLTHHIGSKCYERGLLLLLVAAFQELYKHDIKVNHSIDKGIYCEVIDFDINEKILNEVKSKIEEYVNSDIKIVKNIYSRSDIEKFFITNNLLDKYENLKYEVNKNVVLYSFKNTYDYFYSEMPISSKYMKFFDLFFLNEKGFVLLLPTIYLEGQIKPYEHYEKVVDAFQDFKNFSENQNVYNLADLNKKISNNEIEEFIYINEVYQNKKMLDLIENLSKNDKLKIVLIAGPSSSGKTITSRKMSLMFKSFNREPQYLSVDDFFKERDETPKKPDGKYDFESLNTVDLDLFNDVLKRLLNKEEVVLPTFNFILGRKEYNKKIQLKDNSILIIEGLHALNDELLKDLKGKFKIYISPLCALNIDNHNRISTSDVRLLRRIVRDNMTRGYNCSKTLESWKEVRYGEEKYVFPYQNQNDMVLNSSLVYELGVLRTFVEPLLFSVQSNDKNYDEAIRLINLIRNVLPIPQCYVPYDSILREFIGDSFFEDRRENEN